MDIFADYNVYESSSDIDGLFLWKKHPHFSFPTHFHAALEFTYVVEGKIQIIINGEDYFAESGEILLSNPFEVHTSYKIGDASVCTLVASPEYLTDFNKEYPGKHFHTLLTDKQHNKKIIELLDDVTPSMYNNKTLSRLAKKGLLDLIMDKIITRYGVYELSENHLELSKIIAYIYTNYAEEITLESLAEHFHYSPTALSRKLKKCTGTDLRLFVNNVRVGYAHLMLCDKKFAHCSVMQIASLCGFDSAATFYRAYRRRFDAIPKKAKFSSPEP